MKKVILIITILLNFSSQSFSATVQDCWTGSFDSRRLTQELKTAFPTFDADKTTALITSTSACIWHIDTILRSTIDPVIVAHSSAGSEPLNHIIFSIATNPPSIAANSRQFNSLTIPGLKVGDIVSVSKPTYTTGCFILGGLVTAPDTLSVAWGNLSASACDPPLETYKILVVRP